MRLDFNSDYTTRTSLCLFLCAGLATFPVRDSKIRNTTATTTSHTIILKHHPNMPTQQEAKSEPQLNLKNLNPDLTPSSTCIANLTLKPKAESKPKTLTHCNPKPNPTTTQSHPNPKTWKSNFNPHPKTSRPLKPKANLQNVIRSPPKSAVPLTRKP